ncbi:MAG TPA: Bax inhibitor-1/YccA family protein [Bacteroidales bacterium]|nr:Bax inhibitor-1/YccA family protein [Bacteroidales bacterium]
MMENFENKNLVQNISTIDVVKAFMYKVFSWMFFALSITALVAYWFASNEALISLLYTERGLSALGWLIMLSPLGLVLLMSFRFDKLSASAMTGIFVLYSILMGMSLSTIFLIYTVKSIAITFSITAGMFGVMAITGYVTKTDLTKFGAIMFMGLIGIIIASLVNFFAKSSSLDYIISFLGVLIFTGLTAYDVQKLKQIGLSSSASMKTAIYGALSLYLDFINLFLFLLRFFGNRK